MPSIIEALSRIGPTRSSKLVKYLAGAEGITPVAARKRLSRANIPVARHSRDCLPKREAFFYLQGQFWSERYWCNLLRDLRETGSIYACAIDGLAARGGIVSKAEFPIVSGAPLALKNQVTTRLVAQRLIRLGFIFEKDLDKFGSCFTTNPQALPPPISVKQARVRRLTEKIILDGLRKWIGNNGIGSYDSIEIRGDRYPLEVGQYLWDLTAPSYLHAVKRNSKKNGFVVADVFCGGQLNKHSIRYFVRKVQTCQKASQNCTLFPIIMADEFTTDAFTAGHRNGLMLTTPENLFGRTIARALGGLVETLNTAATNTAVDFHRLCHLIEKLSEIEGRAGNLRGILFELIVAEIARRKYGGKTAIGIVHAEPENGNQVEMDVVCETDRNEIRVIECRGKSPSSEVKRDEVQCWLRKLGTMRNYVASQEHLRERRQLYEFWTSSEFEGDALRLLEFEKEKRTKYPIKWKNGRAVRRASTKLRLTAIGKALDEHFVRHPFSLIR